MKPSYVTTVLLRRSLRLVRATPQTVAAYTGNNTLPVDVAMRGLPPRHHAPVFDTTPCGNWHCLENPDFIAWHVKRTT